MGSLTPEAAEFIGKLVRAKYNIFVSGGTGAGKTTFLNAMSDFIPRMSGSSPLRTMRNSGYRGWKIWSALRRAAPIWKGDGGSNY